MIERMNSTDSNGAHSGGFPERRSTNRVPGGDDVRYLLVQSRAAKLSGGGTTRNIGSGGMRFSTDEELPIGRTVELSVNWPARLDGTCPLQFVATGRVIRSDAQRAAVRIE